MNLREYLNENNRRQYYQINREEANYVAILYHLLLLPENLKLFLNYINPPFQIEQIDHSEIYLEYAYIRDIWNIFKKDEELNSSKRRDVILEYFNENKINSDLFKESDTKNFNIFFGIDKEKASSKFIESPRNWKLINIYKNYKNSENRLSNKDFEKDFEKICKFKMVF